jgi:hypothetical protein
MALPMTDFVGECGLLPVAAGFERLSDSRFLRVVGHNDVLYTFAHEIVGCSPKDSAGFGGHE